MVKKSTLDQLKDTRLSCMKTNDSFSFSRVGSSTIILNKEYDSPELRQCILNPEVLMEKGTVVKNSRTTKAVLTAFGSGLDVFIKRYNNKGFKYSLKYMLRKARAFRAWKSAWTIEVCGIPTPKNIAAVSFRKFGVLKSAYLITECLPNTVDVLDFYKIIQGNKELRCQYVDDIVRMIAMLHENGIRHGDLKLSNIYIQKHNDDQFAFGLWDLDGTRFYENGVTEEIRRSEMARVIASYIELGLRIDITLDQSEVENMFLDCYSKNTMVGLKSKPMSELIERYVTKSHKRIMAKKLKK